MSDRTLVASATNLLARGYLAVPTDRKAPGGEPTGALFAVARAIQRVVAFKTPARAVAVIETEPRAHPPLVQQQLARLPELLRVLGVHVVEAAGEHHVVASYVQAALDAGGDAIVVGMDKRFAQLVGDRVWWYDANKDARYTPEMVHKRFAVGPDQVAEWLSLVGDDDAMPGVAGIGAKGATQLLETYGNVAAALAAVAEIRGRTGNALRAALDAIPIELARGRLERDRPLPRPLDELAYAPADAAERNALFKELGFAELLSAQGGAEVRVAVCTTADAVRDGLARLAASPLAVHTLTEDPTPIRGALAGAAIATGAGDAIYVPWDSSGRDALAAWLADAAAPKLGHDIKSAELALRKVGVALAGVTGDPGIASHLAQPSNWAPHDLTGIAKQVLGRALPEEDAVRGVGAQRKAWAAVDVERAGAFAAQYADAAAAAWRELGPTVDAALFAEYRALSEVLIRMELAGIGVDADELGRAKDAFVAIEDDLTKQIEALAGKSFNIGSTKQLGEVLFEQLKLPIVSHTKTGWSTATEALERIEHAHPIVPLVIRWRLLRRMRDMWITALYDCIDPDGRVRSWFHPARSFSGRIVNSNPDLGRVPGRTPEMAMIRRAFVARPGTQLMSVDYNQLGLHVLAHLTKDPALVEPLRAGRDMHRLTASAVLEKPESEIGEAERQIGKVVNFATFAGQGPSALALQLGVPAAEAKELIARFDRRYSLVRAFQDEQSRLAHERGYIVTIAGRHWPIGGLETLDSELASYAERLARRATHEGSVSDVSRRGLLDADRALRAAGLTAQPLVQILDEVLFEVPEAELAEAAKIAAAAMRGAFVLEAPLRVGVEVGPNWADMQRLEV